MKVLCIIPTYNGATTLAALLGSLIAQNMKFDILAIDSSSSDGTKKILEKFSVETMTIAKEEFNHGGTRQLAVRKYRDYDAYIFLTQDAILARNDAIHEILAPFEDETVGAVCGRQLPHREASWLAQHARMFNYPSRSSKRGKADIRTLGIKTAFLSNSFAAYRREALVKIGGFPDDIIFGEDMYVAAKMILTDWSVVYSATAEVYHSHNYSMREEFSRYFDMGVFHSREEWLLREFRSPNSEGFAYVRSELAFLGLKRIHLWPSSLMRNFLKLVGYKLGLRESSLPVVIKKNASLFKSYWASLK